MFLSSDVAEVDREWILALMAYASTRPSLNPAEFFYEITSRLNELREKKAKEADRG